MDEQQEPTNQELLDAMQDYCNVMMPFIVARLQKMQKNKEKE